MLTLIGTMRSRAMRVAWMLEELGLDYQHRPLPPQDAEVRALNPSGKIPVLVEDGLAVRDSTAILTWLADRNGILTHPAGSAARARQDGWTQCLLDELDACLWTAARHSFVLPEARRVPAIKDSLKWEFARSVDRLTAAMGEGPYLMGAEMTVPDIIAGHCALWAERARFPVENAAWAAYAARLQARPAFGRAAARG